MRNMGFDFGLEQSTSVLKRKYQWLLKIPNVSAKGVHSLPPEKSDRPNISFKEISVEHLNETIIFPGKPEYKPISLTLYDLARNSNPVFNWIQKIYDPCRGKGKYQPFLEEGFKVNANLEMYDACGCIIEEWVYENAWPQSVDWGGLDMSDSAYLTMNITLKYDRAYIVNPYVC